MSSQDTISMSSQDTVRKGRPPKTKYQANKKKTIHNFRHRKKSYISTSNSLSVHDNNTSSSHSTRLETSLSKATDLTTNGKRKLGTYSVISEGNNGIRRMLTWSQLRLSIGTYYLWIFGAQPRKMWGGRQGLVSKIIHDWGLQSFDRRSIMRIFEGVHKSIKNKIPYTGQTLTQYNPGRS